MMRVSDRDVRHNPFKNRGTLPCSASQPSATPSWIASFTTLTVCNSPEKACESRTPAIKLLTPTQTPEPITHVGQSRCSPSRETAAHDRLKSPLTISEMRSQRRQHFQVLWRAQTGMQGEK